jgi:uncharacterized membrane protein
MSLLGLLVLIIIVFILGGLTIATYLTILHYRFEPFYSRIASRTSRRGVSAANDEALINSQKHSLFGLPNSVWGIGYYLFLLLPFLFDSVPLLYAARFFATIFLLLTIWFGLRIPRRANSRCFLCMVVNIINAFLAMLLWNLPIF